MIFGVVIFMCVCIKKYLCIYVFFKPLCVCVCVSVYVCLFVCLFVLAALVACGSSGPGIEPVLQQQPKPCSDSAESLICATKGL